MGKGAVHQRQDRRVGHRDGCQGRASALRHRVDRRGQAVGPAVQLTRRRRLQDDGRRRSLDQAHRGTAAGNRRQNRGGRFPRRLESRLGSGRGCAGRRRVPIGGCGQDVHADQYRSESDWPLVLLCAHLHRSEGCERGVFRQPRLLQVDGRRRDVQADAIAARRRSRAVDRSERPAHHDRRQRRWRDCFGHGRALLVVAAQSADGRDVSRERRQPGAVSRLRLTAGSVRRPVAAEPVGQFRRAAAVAALVRRRWVRRRRRRRRSQRFQHRLCQRSGRAAHPVRSHGPAHPLHQRDGRRQGRRLPFRRDPAGVHVTARSRKHLQRVERRASIERWRPELWRHQPRSHGRRQEPAGRGGRRSGRGRRVVADHHGV